MSIDDDENDKNNQGIKNRKNFPNKVKNPPLTRQPSRPVQHEIFELTEDPKETPRQFLDHTKCEM